MNHRTHSASPLLYVQYALLPVLAIGLWIWVPNGVRILSWHGPSTFLWALTAFLWTEVLSYALVSVLARWPVLWDQAASSGLSLPSSWVTAVTAAALGALEELFYRGYFLASALYPVPSSHALDLPRTVAITLIGALSAFLFGLAHIHPRVDKRANTLLATHGFMVGAGYFLTALATNSVWPALLGHAAYNLVELPVSRWRDARTAPILSATTKPMTDTEGSAHARGTDNLPSC